jgi:large subunit ribosomal protein L10
LTRSEKTELIETLTEEFTNASAVVVCDFKGMTVKQMESFRNVAREADIKTKVIKNTIANISLEKAEKVGLELKDNNLFVWGEDLVTLAKTVTKFAKDNEDNFKIKAGHFEGQAVDSSKIDAYSKLASKEEFLGMLLSVWTAPIRNTLYVWTAKQRELVTVLDQIKQQKEA